MAEDVEDVARKRPTLRMVAEASGVSIASVSAVLSQQRGTRISRTTADRIRAAAERLNYRPNSAARSVRTGRSHLILMSLTALSDPWVHALVAATSRAAEANDLTPLLLADGDWHRALGRQTVDAAFIDSVATTRDPEVRLRQLAAGGERLMVFSEVLQPEGFDVVNSPAEPGCLLAMDHLLAHHTRIACLTSQAPDLPDPAGPNVRYRAYSRALQEAGLEVRAEYVGQHYNAPDLAFAEAVRLLQLDDPPEAILATADFAAIAALHAAQRLGLRVPEDVAVMGVGNSAASLTSTPTLSTVGPVDFFDSVADALVRRATGADTSPPHVLDFPWLLHARDSTLPG
ncbi:MAG: LacI family DNA-binding transcriptional regulator [Propionibacteriaceae bacterium]